MKNYILIILLLCLSMMGCSDNKKSQHHVSIETISYDVRKAAEEMDITSLIDTSYFEIIPLETTDECLIAEVSKLYLSNNKIVVYDEMAQGAYIFNRDGSYHAKVRAIGPGPGEYPPGINDIMVSKNHIGVLAPPFGIMLYDFDGKFVKKISLEDTWGMNLFTFDDINYYLVNDWSRSNKGYYHLFKLDTKQNRVSTLFPFPKSDVDNHRGWSLNKYYTLYDNRSLIYFSTIETIYHLTPSGELSPQYLIDIVHKKLPDNLRTGNGRVAMQSSIDNGYTKGIVNIAETSRYLILNMDGGLHYVVYDKKEKETKVIAGVFRIPLFFNLGFSIEFSLDEGDCFLTYIGGMQAYSYKESMDKKKANKTWTKGDGTNAFEKEYIKVLQNMQDDEDNPVVFILKMRN